jgi:hypothetical protein
MPWSVQKSSAILHLALDGTILGILSIPFEDDLKFEVCAFQ